MATQLATVTDNTGKAVAQISWALQNGILTILVNQTSDDGKHIIPTGYVTGQNAIIMTLEAE
jgi:hypothetical protein